MIDGRVDHRCRCLSTMYLTFQIVTVIGAPDAYPLGVKEVDDRAGRAAGLRVRPAQCSRSCTRSMDVFRFLGFHRGVSRFCEEVSRF